MTRWLVAKYMPDLRRREPINVGVLVIDDDGQVASRFVGEIDGGIDGRRITGIRASDNYRAWVAYWRSLAADGASWSELVEETRSAKPSNYFLEVGGETLVSERTEAELADYLFNVVVTKPTPQQRLRRAAATAAADDLFRDLRVQVREKVTVEVPIAEHGGLLDEVFFDYGYKNGHETYMRALNLGSNRTSWDFVHAARYGFEAVRRHDLGSVLALVIARDAPAAQLRLLEGCSDVVDVGDRPRARDDLRKALHLD